MQISDDLYLGPVAVSGPNLSAGPSPMDWVSARWGVFISGMLFH